MVYYVEIESYATKKQLSILKPMKVIVTGADGLLGSNLVRVLLDAGHRVRVFLQDGRKAPTLEGLDIERRWGDILNPDSVVGAFDGCSAVIHAAASTSIWPTRSPIVRRVNIEGTVNAIAAAEKAQMDRFVYIGTANSFTPGTKAVPGKEDTPYDGAQWGLDYMDSKYEARLRVLDAVRERKLPALTVNPTFMIGPFDSTPSSGTMLIRLYQGQVFGYTAGGRCWTHVRDVALAAANALSMGKIGESYIAGNRNLDYGEFFSLAAETIGVAPPRLRVPKPLALLVGAAQSAGAALTGKPPLLGYAAARIAFGEFYYDPSKARAELGMTSTPLDSAVSECFGWLKANGYMEASR